MSFHSDGVYYLNLSTLIELKSATGMTNAGRMKDLSDVLELIKDFVSHGSKEKGITVSLVGFREAYKIENTGHVSSQQTQRLTNEELQYENLDARIAS